jgi:hypothetical protein
MAPDDPTDAAELRRAARYVALSPITAHLGAIEVIIHDLCEGGFQIEHTEPVKLANSAWIDFENPKTFETIEFRCRVVWSRLSSQLNTRGRPLYRSGIRIEEADDANRAALKRLLNQAATPDVESMDKKRKKIKAAAQERASRPVVKYQRQAELETEQIAKIREARRTLRADPIESIRWYNRARYSLSAQDYNVVQEATRQGYREEVLAVWEYLGRKVPLGMIARVFTDGRAK